MALQNRELNQLEAGEEIADFEGGGFGGVRAMGAIVADAGAEIVTDGAGRGLLGIGGAHGVAPLQDGAFRFENHGEDFAGTHEVGELGEEGAFLVNGVETAGLLFGEAHGLDSDDFETGFVDAGKDFALKITTDSIRFDDCESALYAHNNLLRKVK